MYSSIEQLKLGLDKIKRLMFEHLDNSQTRQRPRVLSEREISNMKLDRAFGGTPISKNRKPVYEWIKDNTDKEMGMQKNIHIEYTNWFKSFNRMSDITLREMNAEEIEDTNQFILSWIHKNGNAPERMVYAKADFEKKIAIYYNIIKNSTNINYSDNQTQIETIPIKQSKKTNSSPTSNTLDNLENILSKLNKMLKKPDGEVEKIKLNTELARLRKIAVNEFAANEEYISELDNIKKEYTEYRFSLISSLNVNKEDINKVKTVAITMIDEINRSKHNVTISSNNHVKAEVKELIQFFDTTLRESVFDIPENEEDIQNIIEILLVGKKLRKGIEFDREKGRVPVSIKEFKPDFIFPKLNLALEIKLSKTVQKSKLIVDEINADINAYGKKYSQLLFVIYDIGTIRNVAQYKNGLANDDNINVIVIKH